MPKENDERKQKNKHRSDVWRTFTHAVQPIKSAIIGFKDKNLEKAGKYPIEMC